MLFEEGINKVLTSQQERKSSRTSLQQTNEAMNILQKLLLIINLVHSICGVNQDFTSKFIGNAKRNADKVSATNNKISKLRLILLSDLKQNEIVRLGRRKVARFSFRETLAHGTTSRSVKICCVFISHEASQLKFFTSDKIVKIIRRNCRAFREKKIAKKETTRKRNAPQIPKAISFVFASN